MPELLAAVGFTGAEVSYAGDTALGLSQVDTAADDLVRVALAVLLVDLLLLMIFLRALIAPLYLLATSVLAVGAALGLTTWVFQDLPGQDGVIFYVPFAAAVLLVSLDSDFNIFSVGYIWEEARRRPLREALAFAVPRSTRAINAAGMTLAISFGLVTLIPLGPFQQLAFAVAVGVLIDAFVVRSLLVPSLISLFGRFSGWPGRRLTAPDPSGAFGYLPRRPSSVIILSATSMSPGRHWCSSRNDQASTLRRPSGLPVVLIPPAVLGPQPAPHLVRAGRGRRSTTEICSYPP
ncbi:MAG: MMPL family transporter [Pseudonocardia sp.]